METLIAQLQAGAGASTTLLFVAVIGGAACLFVYGVTTLLSGATDPVRRRLAEATGTQAEHPAGPGIDLSSVVKPVAKYVLPKATEERDSTQLRLIQAGYRKPNTLQQFYAIKALLAVMLPSIVFIAVRWAPQLSGSTVFLLITASAFVGVRLPDFVLVSLRNRRIKRLRNGFPDALDLLVVCVESGLGLVPAIERVAREIEISHEELGQELALVNAEIRAGMERPAALRNLARRSGVEDIGGLVGLLVQTIRFGTSVADALRVYSEEFRDKRMQRAEEQAAKIGTKMIFPLVTCFFPSFFIVAVGPAAMRIVAAFQSM